MLADEQDSLRRVGGKNAGRDFDSVEGRQTDVEQDQIRLEFGGRLDGLRTVDRLTNNLPFAFGGQCPADVRTPPVEIVYYKNAVNSLQILPHVIQSISG